MRLPDWSDEQVEECRSLWEECKNASSYQQLLEALAGILSYGTEKQVTPEDLSLAQSSEERKEHYREAELPKKAGRLP
jgi:hypothetical protein